MSTKTAKTAKTARTAKAAKQKASTKVVTTAAPTRIEQCHVDLNRVDDDTALITFTKGNVTVMISASIAKPKPITEVAVVEGEPEA